VIGWRWRVGDFRRQREKRSDVAIKERIALITFSVQHFSRRLNNFFGGMVVWVVVIGKRK